jgi:transcriptional regulator with XRE-family HTH domain
MKGLNELVFGDLIANGRKLKGWTIKEFIEKLTEKGESVSPGYITKVEQYQEIPSAEMILVMADIFGIDKSQALECAKKTKLEKYDKNLEEKYSKALQNHKKKSK